MDIAVDKVTEIILRVRAVDVKEGPTDPDSGSNPTDDGATDVLISGTDDATEEELRVDDRAPSTTTSAPTSWPFSISGAATWNPRNGPRRCASPASARLPVRGPPGEDPLHIANAGDLLDKGLANLGITPDLPQA